MHVCVCEIKNEKLVTFNNSHWQHNIFEAEPIEMSSVYFQSLLGTGENANILQSEVIGRVGVMNEEDTSEITSYSWDICSVT